MTVVKTSVNDIEENFAKFDLALICEDRYKGLSDSDKILYTILKNQEGLSINSVKNGNRRYVDSNGYIFVEISQEKLCKLLNKSEPTIRKCLTALEKVGLIERVKSGFQKCHKIYVGKAVSTLTLGEYFKKISCEIEEGKKVSDKEIRINTTKAEDIIKNENKKASTVPPVKADKEKSNFDNNIIPQKEEKNADKNEKNKESEVVEIINNSCVNIRKQDLKKCEEEFTDIDKLKEALGICEKNNSHGIKSLRMAYKYGDRNNDNVIKKQGTIFMADSKVIVDGKLKSVTDMTEEEFEQKLREKWGRNFIG